jgi:hypothetical protein
MGLKHQAFFHSLFIARRADQILLLLVPLVIFQITASMGWSGVALFLETLPRYASFPICGALCDWVDRFSLRILSRAQGGAETGELVLRQEAVAGLAAVALDPVDGITGDQFLIDRLCHDSQ